MRRLVVGWLSLVLAASILMLVVWDQTSAAPSRGGPRPQAGTAAPTVLSSLGASPDGDGVPGFGGGYPTATPNIPVSTAFTYQGRVLKRGQPVDGACAVRFTLHDRSSGGAQVGPALNRVVDVNDGVFTETLDFGADPFTGFALWLRLAVSCPPGGPLEPLEPAQVLTAAPLALGLRAGARIEGQLWPAPILEVSNVISGGIGIHALGREYGLHGEGTSLSSVGVYGSSPINGVLGEAAQYGVIGRGARGVQGQSTYFNGSGVYGIANSGPEAWGVVGGSELGIGVFGRSRDNVGVCGEHKVTTTDWSDDCPDGPYGVYGRSFATAGSAAGVVGEIAATQPGGFSAGVRGINNGAGGNGIGVWGSQNGDGWGVYGTSRTGYGVYGVTTEGGGIAVYGRGTGGLGGTGVYGYRAGAGAGVVGQAPDGIGVSGISSDVGGVGGRFSNSTGVALYAENNGQARTQAALRVTNTQSSGGMAAYVTNNSNFATSHFSNGGTGEVLYLQNGGTNTAGTGGGDFIKAVNEAENDVQFRVTTAGQVIADVGFGASGADFAELLPAKPGLSAGDVLVIGEDGELTLSSQPYQTTVAGVYSTQPGFLGGQPVQGEKAGHVPLAVVGVVPVKASAENGPIRPGDLLTTSTRPGHAMRAGDNPPAGAVLGKALGSLKDGAGVVQMLVVLH